MQENSDEKLVSGYLKGNEKSLEILVGLYLKPIYSFVYRYINNAADAEDITQEVFVRVWKNIKKFDSQKSFKTWVFSIAKNASIDFLRKSRLASGEKKEQAFSDFKIIEDDNGIDGSIIDPAPLPDKILECADIKKDLAKAMENLSPKYRMVLFLRYNDHFNFREISESLGESIDTVKSRHRRALIMLKEILSKDV